MKWVLFIYRRKDRGAEGRAFVCCKLEQLFSAINVPSSASTARPLNPTRHKDCKFIEP